MFALISLQKNLQAHLLEDDGSITDQLVYPSKGTLQERLAVYANAYRWRLIEALQKEYEQLYKLLGEKTFLELAEAFIDEYPSQFPSIAEFTKRLPQFLLKYPPYSDKPYLSELAQLVRALNLSLEAADASLLSYETLAAIPAQNWPSLCFKFHPSVQCLAFSWNSFVLWQALVQDKTLPDRHIQTSYCVVWRKELQSYAIALTEPEAVVLNAFHAGYCFADACERVYTKGLMDEAETASFSANLLTRWLNDHLFSEVYIP